MRPSVDNAYALRLTACADQTAAPAPDGQPAPLTGEIEHVVSGERRGFGSEAELIAQLRQLQALCAPRRTDRKPTVS